MGTYQMYDRSSTEGSSTGGMSNAAAAMSLPAHWLIYVTVDDLDAAAGRVKSHGGQVVNGPMDIPGGGRIAQCSDPQGAVFALVTEGASEQ